jgi:tartrate dehydratase alpha subunit/fumarate hydratase class I-like protein
MSGGHFSYDQYHMENIADEIDRLINQNDSTEKNNWNEDVGRHYPPEIMARFKEAAHTIRQAQEMAQRVDWLVSEDDGEESFMTRWDEEVRQCFRKKNKGEKEK